ncbi:MAG TPA: TonB-dependent receptor [Chitinophagaceae bacterium]
MFKTKTKHHKLPAFSHLFLVVVTTLGPFAFLFCQQQDTAREVSLEEVVVRAYESNQRLRDIPAAVNFIGRSALGRFNTVSIVQAVNTAPGVRMEERSPGSYRFNIRGSSLRSPFGVRNVKIYYNDLPFTDPGGHSYLNQLGYYNFNSLEIIKGPGSSLYGAGTGGVLLIEGLGDTEQPGLIAEYSTGSYGLHNIYSDITTGSDRMVSRIGYQHQESDGYRVQSALSRDVFSWTGNFRVGEQRLLKTSFLYGNLFYETPGALTPAEYEANPRAARPGSGAFPGAEAARASIRQKTFLAGASYNQALTPWLQNKTAFYGMFTELRNAAIQNYGRSSEPHMGGRTLFKASFSLAQSELSFDAGGELQEGYISVGIHKNNGGRADTLRTSDEIRNRQAFVFTQATFDHKAWTVAAGASLNFLKVRFERFLPASIGLQRRRFTNQLAPRLALLRKFNKVNLYTSVSRGFSPPTTSELLPTGGAISLDLSAEKGTNYDLGMKGNIVKNLYLDINAFYFRLTNTIVQRRTAGGGDYYINAGKTRQKGVETYLSYPLWATSPIMEMSKLWLSHTWHHFVYRDFKQQTNDFSGNDLPGVAPHILSTGYDFRMRNGLLGTLNYYYSGKLPLNDANTVYANAYHLIGLKVGYQKWVRNKARVKVLAGADNLLDENYSLGNDVNGFGGRYFNAAPGSNYYITLSIQLQSGDQKK